MGGRVVSDPKIPTNNVKMPYIDIGQPKKFTSFWPTVDVMQLKGGNVRPLTKADLDVAGLTAQVAELNAKSIAEMRKLDDLAAKSAKATTKGARFNTLARITTIRIADWTSIILVSDARPPKGFLVDLLVPPDRAEDMLLALQGAFEDRWVPKYGARRARHIFMLQSIGSVIGFWINWVMKHIKVFKFFAS
jgi:hypothetical protein